MSDSNPISHIYNTRSKNNKRHRLTKDNVEINVKKQRMFDDNSNFVINSEFEDFIVNTDEEYSSLEGSEAEEDEEESDNEMVLESDEEDEEYTDTTDYFEYDFKRLHTTLKSHILQNFPKPDRLALTPGIETGITKALRLLQSLKAVNFFCRGNSQFP